MSGYQHKQIILSAWLILAMVFGVLPSPVLANEALDASQPTGLSLSTVKNADDREPTLEVLDLQADPTLKVPVSTLIQPIGPENELDNVSVTQKLTLGKLLPYQPDPLGNRIPLVLVHGIGAEDDEYYHWEEFLKFIDRDPEFHERFKVYLFRYDSNRSVPELSLALRDSLKQYLQGLENERPIRIVAYSEGGLLTRNALQDGWLNDRTEQVITIATPFHGSPLANPDWMRQQAKSDSIFSPVRLSMDFAYWITRRMYPSFEADFQWDNFDQAIATEEFETFNGRNELKGYNLEKKKNFITYGSYFGRGIDPDHILPKALGIEEPLPKEKFKLKQLFSKSFLFTLVRDNIADLPLAHVLKKDQTTTGAEAYVVGEVVDESSVSPATMSGTMLATRVDEPTLLISVADQSSAQAPAPAPSPAYIYQPLMTYNDGISPISSTLWLGRYTPNFDHVKNPVHKAWAALKSIQGTSVARLFKGLDHRNWMEGGTRMETDELTDLLNPDEPPRTVFEWLVFDLMST